MRTSSKILLRTLAVSPFAFLGVMWWITSKFIAPVPREVFWPADVPDKKEDVAFNSRDGLALKGWFIAQANSTRAIVLLHSISMTRTDMLARALWLHSLGYNVLVYDARGCGESAPVFRSFGRNERQDLLGALDWLEARGMKEIGCVGFSQGAATIVSCGAQLPASVKAIVAEGCYTNLRASADLHVRHWVGPLAPFFQAVVVPIIQWRMGWTLSTFSPLHEMPKIKAAVYLIGGMLDDQAPPEGVQQLYDAATGAKGIWLLPQARHTDFYTREPAEYRTRVGAFIQQAMPVPNPADAGTQSPIQK